MMTIIRWKGKNRSSHHTLLTVNSKVLPNWYSHFRKFFGQVLSLRLDHVKYLIKFGFFEEVGYIFFFIRLVRLRVLEFIEINIYTKMFTFDIGFKFLHFSFLKQSYKFFPFLFMFKCGWLKYSVGRFLSHLDENHKRFISYSIVLKLQTLPCLYWTKVI